MAKNTTIYNDSLIRQVQSPATVTALLAAGYSTAVDEQQQLQDVTSLGTYWKHTHVGFAFNPYQTTNPVTQDEAFTQQLISAGRAALGDRLVLENNSLRQGYLSGNGDYQAMYAYMCGVGGPIGFQTATLSKVGLDPGRPERCDRVGRRQPRAPDRLSIPAHARSADRVRAPLQVAGRDGHRNNARLACRRLVTARPPGCNGPVRTVSIRPITNGKKNHHAQSSHAILDRIGRRRARGDGDPRSGGRQRLTRRKPGGLGGRLPVPFRDGLRNPREGHLEARRRFGGEPSQHQPDVGHPSGSTTVGLWAADWGGAASKRTAAGWQAAATNDSVLIGGAGVYKKWIPQLKAWNPNVIILEYNLGPYLQKGSANYTTVLANDPTWFARDSHGNLINLPSFPNNYLMDPSNAAYRAWHASQLAASVAQYGFDGAMDDSMGAGPLGHYASGTPVDTATGQPYTAQQWLSEQVLMLNQDKAALNGKYLAFNGLVSGPMYVREFVDPGNVERRRRRE